VPEGRSLQSTSGTVRKSPFRSGRLPPRDGPALERRHFESPAPASVPGPPDTPPEPPSGFPALPHTGPASIITDRRWLPSTPPAAAETGLGPPDNLPPETSSPPEPVLLPEAHPEKRRQAQGSGRAEHAPPPQRTFLRSAEISQASVRNGDAPGPGV